MKFLTALSVALVCVTVTAYPSGAPETACDLPVPNHGFQYQPNFLEFPYDLDLTQISRNKVKAVLRARSGKYWRGLFVNMTMSNGEYSGEVTSFSSSEYQRRCNGNGVTHRDNDKKTYAEFEWTDRSRFRHSQTLTLTITVVRNRTTSYVAFRDITMFEDFRSDRPSILGGGVQPPKQTTPTTTTTTPTTSTTTTIRTTRPTTRRRRPTTTYRTPTTTTTTIQTTRPTIRRRRPTTTYRTPTTTTPTITTATTTTAEPDHTARVTIHSCGHWRDCVNLFTKYGTAWWKYARGDGN